MRVKQKLLFEKLRDIWDAMPRHRSFWFLVLPCYLQDAMLCQWSSSDLPWELRIWESLKVNMVSCWSSKDTPGQVFVWITTIHIRGIMVGSIYVPKASFEIRFPQPWKLVLNLCGFHSHGPSSHWFRTCILKSPIVSSRLFWPLDHRALCVVIDG